MSKKKIYRKQTKEDYLGRRKERVESFEKILEEGKVIEINGEKVTYIPEGKHVKGSNWRNKKASKRIKSQDKWIEEQINNSKK